MNRCRGGVLAAAGLVILLLGIVVGSRIASSGQSAAPTVTIVVLPTALPPAGPSPQPTAPLLPRGLTTRYYRSDTVADAQVDLRVVGRQVVASVTSHLTTSEVYMGTLRGAVLIATAPRNPYLDAPHTHHTLTIVVTHPGEADIAQTYPANNAGVTGYTVQWPATCGAKTDAVRGQSCRALATP